MRKSKKRNSRGFTLIEMLLVMVIISAVLYMAMGYIQQRALSLRIDRTSGQMQQLLNAGMIYYVSNGKWPTDIATDLQPLYIPGSGGVSSPWNSKYAINSTNNSFYVSVRMLANSSSAPYIARVIVGTLPSAFTAIAIPAATIAPTPGTCTAATCYVVASVAIPSQSLSNASAINFAGFYHNGACVPEPNCPTGYTSQVIPVPVSVNGYYDAPTVTGTCTATDTSGCSMSYKPISGFTAYATSPSASATPPGCGTNSSTACRATSGGAALSASNKYYRVCLAVQSEAGAVNPTTNPWGQLVGTIMVMSRCNPPEATSNPTNYFGSDFTVWEPSS